MNNLNAYPHELEYNQRAEEIDALLAEVNAWVAALQQIKNNIIPYTTEYRLAQEQRQMMEDYYNDETNIDNNPK